MFLRYLSVIGGIILVNILPILSIQSQEQPAPQPAKVREELISIDVRDKPFGEIIAGITEQTGKNIYYDDDVKDILITIKLINVPWRSVLEIIAKKYNCMVEEVTGGTAEVIKISKPPTVTMEFEGADIRDVINQIATIANRNIVISEAVQGAVSLRLKNVPWQDALEAIIKTRGYVLVREREDRILRVVPTQDIETQLETRIFKLRFIRPKSIYIAKMNSPYFQEKQMQMAQTGRVEISSFSLLNALNAVVTPTRGRITYDEQTNTVIITDTKPQIDKMGEIIQELDKEPKQVFIDVKFVRTTNSDIFDFGIDVGDNGVQISQSFGSMATRMPFSLGKTGFEDAIAAAPQADIDAGLPSDGDFPAEGSRFKFGQLDFSKTSFTLRLLKKDIKSKIVQAPKIITLDNHEATIFVGRTISFARSNLLQNDNGTTSIELREAENSPAREGFQILVVPHVISGSNKIQLTIIPSNDQLTGKSSALVPGFNRFATQDAAIDLPEVTQQVVVSHMLLESGQTAVLGGLLTINQGETIRRVPFLGDIPYLGYFFKSKSITKNKEDMFIFVTPRIVQSAEDTQEKIQALIDVERKQSINKYMSIWKDDPAPAKDNKSKETPVTTPAPKKN